MSGAFRGSLTKWVIAWSLWGGGCTSGEREHGQQVPPDAEVPDATVGPEGPRSPIRFFLSGHSLTDDPLADFVVDVARSFEVTSEYNEQIVIGSPIRARTRGPDPSSVDFTGYRTGKNREGEGMDVLAELASPATITPGTLYDTLVITERHDLPGVVEWEGTVFYLRDYHDRFIAANPAGRTFLYHSWLHIDKDAPEAFVAYESAALAGWECVASKVNLDLGHEGRDDRVEILAAGGALVALVERIESDSVPGIEGTLRERLDAVFVDDVHNTPLGKYFVALVVYATISGGSPVGAAVPDGVDPGTAAAFQEIAAEYVSERRAAGLVPSRTMAECRGIFVDLCAPFHAALRTPELVPGCIALYSDESAPANPFRGP